MMHNKHTKRHILLLNKIMMMIDKLISPMQRSTASSMFITNLLTRNALKIRVVFKANTAYNTASLKYRICSTLGQVLWYVTQTGITVSKSTIEKKLRNISNQLNY